jgi:hypothetical protein
MNLRCGRVIGLVGLGFSSENFAAMRLSYRSCLGDRMYNFGMNTFIAVPIFPEPVRPPFPPLIGIGRASLLNYAFINQNWLVTPNPSKRDQGDKDQKHRSATEECCSD